MGRPTGFARGGLTAVCMAACLSTVDAQDEAEDAAAPFTVEFAGRISAGSRVFPAEGALPGQRALANGFAAEPTLYVESPGGQSFTLAPFFRYDHSDPRRTHFDVREAYLLFFGDVGSGGWEARVGVGQVFWGVTESQRLVDVVNQVDFVEHPNGEAKLGQPMAHFTWFGDWGTLEAVGMTLHRARTFPGRQGRLRLPVVTDPEDIRYESGAGRWGPDIAARYSRSPGPLDLGVSLFEGTSREPFFLSDPDAADEPTLVQFYDRIRQFGLDAQLTTGAWLLKAEAIHRRGGRNLFGREQDYVALAAGGEHTFYAAGGGDADVVLLGEWSYDSRGPAATPSRSPNTLENDVFLAARVPFNDVQSTEVVAGILADASRSTRSLAFEFSRRVSSRWSVRAEAVVLLRVDPRDIHYEMRHDSFFDLGLVYNF